MGEAMKSPAGIGAVVLGGMLLLTIKVGPAERRAADPRPGPMDAAASTLPAEAPRPAPETAIRKAAVLQAAEVPPVRAEVRVRVVGVEDPEATPAERRASKKAAAVRTAAIERVIEACSRATSSIELPAGRISLGF
jgi:hypothetical protein